MSAAAFFDVDGTLVRGTVLHYYAWVTRRSVALPARWWRLALLACRIPRYWWLDRLGRDRFLRAFYRSYAGYTSDGLRALQEDLFRELIAPRLLREGETAARAHRAAGHRVVILSASVRFVLEPLARYLGADELICQEMVLREGVLTGELEGPPLSGEERARQMHACARRHGLDLSASYAYGDSAGDIPMLASVGHPIAVNPSRSLSREAGARGWPIARWQ